MGAADCGLVTCIFVSIDRIGMLSWRRDSACNTVWFCCRAVHDRVVRGSVSSGDGQHRHWFVFHVLAWFVAHEMRAMLLFLLSQDGDHSLDDGELKVDTRAVDMT